MKKLLFLIVLSLLISCEGNVQVSTQSKEEPIGLRQHADDYAKNVTEFTYGGCQYIKVGVGDCAWGSHKGNCTNPIHKN